MIILWQLSPLNFVLTFPWSKNKDRRILLAVRSSKRFNFKKNSRQMSLNLLVGLLRDASERGILIKSFLTF